MTVYKGCQIALSNIQVDSIHAGTQLSVEQVQTLNLPNLIPRACGVDIRPDTEVLIDDERGIVTGPDITGFETCYDQSDQIDDNRNDVLTVSRVKLHAVKRLSFMDGIWILAFVVTALSVGYAVKIMIYDEFRDKRRLREERVFDVTDLWNRERTPLLSEPYICL